MDTSHPACAEPLEDGVTYKIRFRDFAGPGKHEYMEILHHSGYWISPNDGDMGPIRVAVADYEVVGKAGAPA